MPEGGGGSPCIFTRRSRCRPIRRTEFGLGLSPMGEREGHVRGGDAALARGRLWWLIGGRVAVGALLLGVGALWTGAAGSNGSEPGRLSGALPVAVTVLVLSFLY